MKKLFLSLLFATTVAVMWAVPAKRGVWRNITLADGTSVKAELRGDEYVSWWQTENGQMYVRQSDADVYVLTTAAELQQKAAKERNDAAPLRSPQRVTIGGTHPDFIGEKKGLIILAEFTDQKFQPGHDAEYFSHVANDRYFVSDDGHNGSIRDYFLSQSGGQFDLTFDVVGPIALKKDMAYYGGHSQYGGHDKNAASMITESVQGAAAVLGTFAPYDWFNDGYVDQVFVIYAGRGEASGGGDDTIWPHRSELYPALQLGGKRVKVYACANEMMTDNMVNGIGTFCHEFSHCLGLPDLYDIDYGGNYGMANWDIMCSGSYNGNSFCPCGYSGYERNYCGWKEPIYLTEDTEINNLKGMEDGGDYYIIKNDAYNNEYYILENRTQSGWDRELYGSGLLITYIDFDQNIWSRNRVNTTDGSSNDHQRCVVVPADNNFNESNGAVGCDAYPYNSNNFFTNYSVPAATLNHANTDGKMFLSKPVTNITKNADGTVSFVFRNEVGMEDEPLPEGVVFYESFRHCYGAGGNDNKWGGTGVGSGIFIADNEGWNSMQKYAGDGCACIGKKTQSGLITTPEIAINGQMVFSFKVAPYTGEASSVTLAVASGEATLSETTFDLTAGQWADCHVTLTGTGKVKLNFKSKKGRFFLDEVKLRDSSAAISGPTVSDVRAGGGIYSIDGRYIGTDKGALAPGLYIVNGKKYIKK